MPIKHASVSGIGTLEDFLKQTTPEDVVYILFSGGHDSTGVNWCPDCVAGT